MQPELASLLEATGVRYLYQLLSKSATDGILRGPHHIICFALLTEVQKLTCSVTKLHGQGRQNMLGMATGLFGESRMGC